MVTDVETNNGILGILSKRGQGDFSFQENARAFKTRIGIIWGYKGVEGGYR